MQQSTRDKKHIAQDKKYHHQTQHQTQNSSINDGPTDVHQTSIGTMTECKKSSANGSNRLQVIMSQ